jgi:recombination protein RecA
MDEKEKENKAKALQQAVDQIEKNFGKGSVMKLGDNPILKIESISTSSISLDACLGIGGIPKGRITEIYGPESSGKTTVCLHVIAEAQRRGGVAAFIDTEHALDINYAKRIGVDVKNLLFSQPDFGEQALEIVETLIRSNAIDIIVIDSVAALTPRAELEGDMGDPTMGVHARLMSQALRKLTAAISKSNAAVIFTNQLRSKIGVMFGNPETTTGGNAMKFYASVRLDIRKKEVIKDGNDIIGNRVKIKVVKNKVAPPFRETEFDILYNEGISKLGDLIDAAVTYDVINKSGSWFSYKGDRLGQGREAVRKCLLEDTALYESVEKNVKYKLGILTEEPTDAKDTNTEEKPVEKSEPKTSKAESKKK